MTTELSIANVTDSQASEIGLPSPAALQYMMSVANMLLTSALLTPDMEPPKDSIQALVQSKWEQKDIDKYRDDVVKSNALAKMLVGREMGMQAMEALQDINIVKGRIFVRYPQLISQIEKRGYKCRWVERSNERAALEVQRGDDAPLLFEFTIEDAKRAHLTDSAPGKEQYNQYHIRPRVMLTARVASEAFRTIGGRANVYTPEEKQEIMQASTTEEADEADAQRMEVLQAKYHVGLKADAAAPVDTTASAPPQAAAPEPEKPRAAKKEKAADKVVAMPVAPEANHAPKANGVAAEVTTEAAVTAAAPATTTMYLIYYRDREGGISRMTSETPQSHLDNTRLRAMALANQTGGTYYVYPAVDGVVNPDTDPLFTAAPPAASTNPAAAAAPAKPISTLKQRLLDITAMVARVANEGLAADKIIPEKTIAARVKTFFLGYFAIGKLADLPPDTPENAGIYASCFADLEACARRDANVLLSAPEDTGKRMAADTVRLGGVLNGELKWHPDNVALGFRVARLRGMEHSDMITFLENSGLIVREAGGGWKCASTDDIGAALSLCLVTRQAGRFIRECNAYHVSIATALEFMEERRFMGKTISEVSAADAEKAIEWAMTAIKEKVAADAKRDQPAPAKQRPAPPAPSVSSVPPAPDAGDGEDDLFDALP